MEMYQETSLYKSASLNIYITKATKNTYYMQATCRLDFFTISPRPERCLLAYHSMRMKYNNTKYNAKQNTILMYNAQKNTD